MKRILTAALCLMLLTSLALPGVLAESAGGWYVVDSEKPKGYCYLYSAASSMDDVSRNLGRYNNGAYVYVIDYYGGNGYCRVQTQDGKTGYINSASLRRYYGDVWADSSPGWFLVVSKEPDGYCYRYSKPSSRDGVGYNKGRHNNGDMVYVLSYYGGQDGSINYCFVRTQDGATGYINAASLKRISDIIDDPNTGWYAVSSSSPRGYCYLYSAASDQDGVSRNKGRYNNGEWVYVVEYDGGNGYCYVFTQDGKTGFIHDYALKKY